MLKLYFYLIVSLFFISNYSAQMVNGQVKEDWSVSWVSPPAPFDTIENTWLCWRNTIELASKPEGKVSVNISVDSKYWLYINGKLIIREGQLKRGPTPTDSYYDEVEIGKYFKVGKNTIAILHWYFGKNGFSHKSSGKAGLLFELKSSNAREQKILDATDYNNRWKTMPHVSYLRKSDNPQPNYRLSESNIHYDGNLTMGNWTSINYDPKAWTSAVMNGMAGSRPWGKLWKRPIPQFYNSSLKSYTKTIRRYGKDNDTIIAYLPKNVIVLPYMDIQAKGGETVTIRTDNYYGGSAPNVRADYKCKAGRNTFEVLGYQNGHEVWYIFPKSIKVNKMFYRTTSYNTKNEGYFVSDDAALNSLWVKSRNTLDLSMRDNYMDCPDRERAQWWGDAVLQIGETFYAYDRKTDLLTQKAISNFLEWQKKDSVLFAPVPAGNWDTELPGQSLATIWGIYDYFIQSGDTSIMIYAYPFVKKYMALWKIDDRGLVQHRKGGWMWHDWGDKLDIPLLDNTWYFRALEALQVMASLKGEESIKQECILKQDRLRTAFNTYYWKGDYYASEDYRFTLDDRANGMAAVVGICDKNQWDKMRPYLDTAFRAGPYLEKYILEAYFKNNDVEAGIRRMKNRYKSMIESPISTLWEGWEIGSATYGGGTYNHGWTGGPLTLMSQYMGGISPSLPGYSSFEILPRPAHLKSMKVVAKTKKGLAKVIWNKYKNNALLHVLTPKSSGVIGVPKMDGYSIIKLNGGVIWNKNKAVKNNIYVSEDDHHIKFALPKGEYLFELK
jgi:alpha-L-rhamnosidase